MKTITDKIKESYSELPEHATNRNVADRYREKFGSEPSPAMLFETLGSESKRKLKQFNGAELVACQQTCTKVFGGDYQRYADAVSACAKDVIDAC